MPIERHPKKLAPRIPTGGQHVAYHPGLDPKRREDWKTVAADFGVDVKQLIYYNFETTNPDVVNWYLRNYVGCKTTRDGLNWAFSPEASPGIIYIPTQPPDFTDIIPPGPGGRNSLARHIDRIKEDLEDSETERWERIHFGLDVAEAAHIAIGIVTSTTDVELGVAGLGLEITGPFMTLAGTFLSLGGAVLGAVEYRKQDQTLRGFSYGVVLGANGADAQWLRSSWFVQGQYFSDVNYPEYVKQYQGAYFSGLKVGLAYGRQLNGPEATVLMKILSSKAHRSDDDFMTYWDRLGGELPLMTFAKWKKENFASKHEVLTDNQKVDYYLDCANMFRRDFLPRLKQ